MATLLLTAVGTALGGPIGGAIGALAGQAFDQTVLFAPRGRTGPRLNDLQVQTSSYGSQIPKLFGTMRVAGTVIWATDLRETSTKSGGGKGRPSVTTFDYAASFAVALSARPIRSVRRIWAEGNLLRGSAGDFKTELGAFRLHLGGEDQPVDPLIASAQGLDETPANRGIAYAVFEDLALADYGNRIPSLTFEVEADEGPVAVEAIAKALGGGGLSGEALGLVGGFAASGASVGDALAPLVEGHGLALDGLMLRGVGDVSEGTVDAGALCARVNGRAREPLSHRGGAAEDAPLRLSVRHYDAARDYQAGVQTVSRPGPGRTEQGMELPVVLTAGAARALAADRLRAAWAGRATMEAQCGWDALTLRPGALVTVEHVGGLWRIEEREWEGMAVRLVLRRVPGGVSALPGGASGGTIVRETDAPHGPTTLMLADLPPLGDGLASAPMVVAAASGGRGVEARGAADAGRGRGGRPAGPGGGARDHGTAGDGADARRRDDDGSGIGLRGRVAGERHRSERCRRGGAGAGEEPVPDRIGAAAIHAGRADRRGDMAADRAAPRTARQRMGDGGGASGGRALPADRAGTAVRRAAKRFRRDRRSVDGAGDRHRRWRAGRSQPDGAGRGHAAARAGPWPGPCRRFGRMVDQLGAAQSRRMGLARRGRCAAERGK
ncbi:MAG: phage tail protein [Sphingobium sp.]|nr:phage tail protein [Sphingobium sp.]